jgi:hypothetical protein
LSLIGCTTTQKKQELQSFEVNLSNLNQTSQPQLMKSLIEEWQVNIKNELDKTLKPHKIFIPASEIGWNEIASLNLENYLYSFSDVLLSDEGICKIIFENNNNTVVINENYKINTSGQWRGGLFEVQSYYFMCIFSLGTCIRYREYRNLSNYQNLRPDFFYLYEDVLISLENWKLLNKYRNIILPDDINTLQTGSTYFIHSQNITIRNSIGNNSYSVETQRGGYQFVISGMPDNQRSGNNFALMFNGSTTVVTQGGFLRLLPEFIFVERIILPERKSNYQILGRNEMYEFMSGSRWRP